MRKTTPAPAYEQRLNPLSASIGVALGRRLFFLMILCAMLASCAHGTMRTPDVLLPNLDIPAAQLQPATEAIPAVASTDEVDLLRNHVTAARMYHALALQVNSLVCTLTRATGITINGTEPKPGEACEAVDQAAMGKR